MNKRDVLAATENGKRILMCVIRSMQVLSSRSCFSERCTGTLTEPQTKKICICCIAVISGTPPCGIPKARARRRRWCSAPVFRTFPVVLDQRVWPLLLSSSRGLVDRFRAMAKTGELLRVCAGLLPPPNSDQLESTRAELQPNPFTFELF